MFYSTIQQHQISIPSNNQFLHNKNDSSLDLQYQIYSKYLQMSKQKFAIKQLQLMNDTQRLIQQIMSTKNLQQPKQSTSTMESFTFYQDSQASSSIIMQDFSTIQRRSPKKLTRKSGHQSLIQSKGRSKQQFDKILLEIQKNCCQKTYNVVNSLFMQHRKNLSKIIQIQKKQKSIQKIVENNQKLEQQNLVLKKKISQFQEKICKKDEQIKALKDKFAQASIIEKENIYQKTMMLNHLSSNSKDKQNLGQSKTHPRNNCNNCYNCSNFSQVSTINSQISSQKYLDKQLVSKFLAITKNKQKYVQNRYRNIQQIELKIQQSIQNAVLSSSSASNLPNQPTCPSKCCIIIKKIKQSVMNYRQYLEKQAQECQNLYNILKNEIEQGFGYEIQDRMTLEQQKIDLNR